ncbi:hypothetical protein T265_05400 [Opisthorchis viverrini]|uniref:Uncharacterized protein n=1 Tax=Opisthorchis viverrini TaxID=6198 RepID=A0A074ZJR6_OPIVI|nr:hypothetical protein T265_05400 [Opisthorchis viverrini]KER27583.1 hypothetical protein T265_05400 [Opisthorchis viverrini]
MRRPGAAHSVAWKHHKREIQLSSRFERGRNPQTEKRFLSGEQLKLGLLARSERFFKRPHFSQSSRFMWSSLSEYVRQSEELIGRFLTYSLALAAEHCKRFLRRTTEVGLFEIHFVDLVGISKVGLGR